MKTLKYQLYESRKNYVVIFLSGIIDIYNCLLLKIMLIISKFTELFSMNAEPKITIIIIVIIEESFKFVSSLYLSYILLEHSTG